MELKCHSRQKEKSAAHPLENVAHPKATKLLACLLWLLGIGILLATRAVICRAKRGFDNSFLWQLKNKLQSLTSADVLNILCSNARRVISNAHPHQWHQSTAQTSPLSGWPALNCPRYTLPPRASSDCNWCDLSCTIGQRAACACSKTGHVMTQTRPVWESVREGNGGFALVGMLSHLTVHSKLGYESPLSVLSSQIGIALEHAGVVL